MRLRNRKPIGFRSSVGFPLLKFSLMPVGSPRERKNLSQAKGDRAIGNDLIPFGLSADYSGFGGAGHQLFSGLPQHRL